MATAWRRADYTCIVSNTGVGGAVVSTMAPEPDVSDFRQNVNLQDTCILCSQLYLISLLNFRSWCVSGDQVCPGDEEGGGPSDSLHGEGEGRDEGSVRLYGGHGAYCNSYFVQDLIKKIKKIFSADLQVVFPDASVPLLLCRTPIGAP